MSHPRIAVIQHEDRVPLDLLATGLADAEVVTIRPGDGDPLPQPHDVDGLVVLGGSMHVHADDTAPWLPAVRELLRESVAAGTPVLGVCLGAQLLAVALGGEVTRSAPSGPERGLVELRMRPDAASDPLLAGIVAGFGRDVLVASSHADAISVLPDDATWLASSRQYPFQAFRVGSTAWGLQFHPEAGEDTLADWAASHGEDPEATRESYRANATHLEKVAHAVGRSFVEIVGARVAS